MYLGGSTIHLITIPYYKHPSRPRFGRQPGKKKTINFMRMYRESWPSGPCGLRAVRPDPTLTGKTQGKKSKGWGSLSAAGLSLGLRLGLMSLMSLMQMQSSGSKGQSQKQHGW